MAKKTRVRARRQESEELVTLPAGPCQLPIRHVSYRPRHARQQLVKELWPESKAMFLTGEAGTGKTHAAFGMALLDIVTGRSRKIFLCRPVVATEEELGYSPGTIEEKLRPWMGPFCDVLDEMGCGPIDAWMDKIEFISIGMLGGRTIRDATMIVDESQNVKLKQYHRALTRVGQNGRIVFCGDYQQSELNISPNPMKYVCNKLNGRVAKVNVIRFLPEDQQRDPFVTEVLRALE